MVDRSADRTALARTEDDGRTRWGRVSRALLTRISHSAPEQWYVNLPCTILQRDQDTKYVHAFDDMFIGEGRTTKKTCPRSPNLQAFVERVIQTLKHEVLNAFCVVSEKHLVHILRVSQDWYNHRRDHSVRDHLPPVRDNDDPPVVNLTKRKLVCHTELGGHLKAYGAAA